MQPGPNAAARFALKSHVPTLMGRSIFEGESHSPRHPWEGDDSLLASSLLGVGVVALPASIITAGCIQEMQEQQDRDDKTAGSTRP